MSLPGANQPAAAPAAAATIGTSDHAQMVGRLAVGYLGMTVIGAGANVTANPGPNDTPYAISGNAPVVGVRYWIDPMIGIDAGLGMSVIGGTVDPGVPNADKIKRQSFTGFILHGGVPLALASADHFTFEIIPELNIGFASSGRNPPGDGDVSMSGFHFDIGARAGAEINFGFIHIPQLSLVASVGLRFDSDKGSTKDTTPVAPAPHIDSSSSRSEFHTTVGSNPWAIFTDNVAALYYF
ncbi:MAG TPA: hypothetical protein VGQ57_17740 [Polyangiaceae bacterium]|nr:hypothetical protein [Polyangiaceae bacterium]